MTTKTLEKQVKTNAAALDNKMPGLIKKHSGKYVLYHDGKITIVDTFDAAVKLGIKTYGSHTGFVARKIMATTPVLSALVVL